ncbi:Protease synthase and sporulation negative regulatory protein PAI 1 [compost metagenome]|jgi:Acetyltransferases|uniref:GNAT family N-acetyltransferase n=1 Tax=Sphingobacterium TaxID=28453 RepID=UPI000FADA9E1|nr:GNAT family N-acetyltransferase [Sphingobacterium sp. GVS05A]
MGIIEIKRVTVDDIAELQKIGRETFLETFSESNNEENMASYLSESFSEIKLIKELNNAGSEFYFAVDNNTVIGYLKLNTGKYQTEIQDDKALEIERIYVLRAFHGKKVGQILYEKALQIAEVLGLSFIWLGVWEKNLRAIQFYEKNGFVAFDKHIFKLGDDEQTDIMMKKELIK